MLTRRHRRLPSLSTATAAVVLAATAAATHGAITADAVISYNPGAGAKTAYWLAPLDNPAAALGLPASHHNVNDIFDTGGNQIAFADHSALTPFSAAFAPDEIVSFGAGGHLTLRLSSPVATAAGPALGVHTGSGLNDSAWPTGTNSTPADALTDDRVAVVEISADNATWFSLGLQTFDLPTNYFAAGLASPYAASAGTAVADFAKPFTGTLADFSGLDWNATLNLLNGSAGGAWLDLSTATGPGALPSSIQYVRFSLPANSTDTFVLDSVTAIPEPSTLALSLTGALPLLRRRRAR